MNREVLSSFYSLSYNYSLNENAYLSMNQKITYSYLMMWIIGSNDPDILHVRSLCNTDRSVICLFTFQQSEHFLSQQMGFKGHFKVRQNKKVVLVFYFCSATKESLQKLKQKYLARQKGEFQFLNKFIKIVSGCKKLHDWYSWFSFLSREIVSNLFR